ncbi:TPA: glycosyl transferase [Proteus mirabilis]|uniref:ATP-grasp fold amidoligase family protein n=2 Tax=Proteus mirabilis TaxID=584 RepID=UPI00080A810D|nr:ATP-grasp fold amidoligase family protein [Proteus mirabilis]ELA7682650.1 glycosyl transferase [Proteus mirabilis]MBB6653343.1 glycosyl transferase [Proteus mirabilis]MBI6205576.1 glycosyl transferase [Proteus mirabilis]MBI6372909.1 glycosyl transferase [Proteus mirabilis]MBS3879269.1 glycosyl transferase [Proteus mirabilis]
MTKFKNSSKFFFYKILKLICFFSPEIATRILYKRRLGKKLNLASPKTFNEKLQWLKLNRYKNNPLVTKCADKYAVREYIKEKGLEHTLNDLIGIWDNPEDITWEKLPHKFAMKCNHGAGYNIICNNKDKLNKKETQSILKKWMDEDYWIKTIELCYKNIEKKIICEKFIETEDGSFPFDYKIFCFNGKATFIMLCTQRETKKPKYFFVDKNWKLLPYGLDFNDTNSFNKIKKPNNLNILFNYAERLAEPFPFVRADFYLDNEKIIFGELTFVPAAGYDDELNNDSSNNIDLEIGHLLKL